MKTFYHHHRGFSLLEILIAMTILTFITLGVVKITDNSLKTKERVIPEDREVLDVEMALMRIEHDFSQIYSPLFFSTKEVPPSSASGGSQKYSGNDRFSYASANLLPVPEFISDEKSSFEFLSAVNKRRYQDSKSSSYIWIRYSLRPAEKTGEETKKDTFELIRTASANNPYKPDRKELEEQKSLLLLNNILSWEFSFWDPNKKKFETSLNNVEEGKHRLYAIKVKYTWLDKTAVEVEGEKIFRSLWPPFKEKIDDKKPSTGGDES